MASAAARRSEAEAGIPSAVAELRANEAHLAKVAAYCQRKYAQARTESVREAATQETRAYLTDALDTVAANIHAGAARLSALLESDGTAVSCLECEVASAVTMLALTKDERGSATLHPAALLPEPHREGEAVVRIPKDQRAPVAPPLPLSRLGPEAASVDVPHVLRLLDEVGVTLGPIPDEQPADAGAAGSVESRARSRRPSAGLGDAMEAASAAVNAVPEVPARLSKAASASRPPKPPAAAAVSTSDTQTTTAPALDLGGGSSDTVAASSSGNDPAYARFQKMLDMGIPDFVVKQKAALAGLDPELLDVSGGQGGNGGAGEAPSTAATSGATGAGTPNAAGVVLGAGGESKGSDVGGRVRDNEAYARFLKMIDMGIPDAVVKQKATLAGLRAELLDTPGAILAASGPTTHADDGTAPAATIREAPAAPTARAPKARAARAPIPPEAAAVPAAPAARSGGGLVKDDPSYAKFLKMMSMGIPDMVVRQKAALAGLDPELLATPDAPLPTTAGVSVAQPRLKSAPKPPAKSSGGGAAPSMQDQIAAAAKKRQAKSDAGEESAARAPPLPSKPPARGMTMMEQIAAAGKRRAAGWSGDAVAGEDRGESVDSSHSSTSAPVGATPAAVTVAPPVKGGNKVKDDPTFAKFFKMLQMGIPEMVVRQKAALAGLDPELLATPEAKMPKGSAAAAKKATAAPKLRKTEVPKSGAAGGAGGARAPRPRHVAQLLEVAALR